MKKCYLLLMLMLMIFLIPIMVCPQSAKALMISLDDGTNPVVTLTDNGAFDLNPALGIILYSGSIGNWNVQTTVGTSYPIIGSPANPQIDLFSLSINNTGAPASLSVMVSDIGYTAQQGFITTVGGTTTGQTVALNSFFDTSNTHFGTANQIANANFGPFVGLGAFSATMPNGSIPVSVPYSLTLQANIYHNSVNQLTSLDAFTQVPEPGTLMLLGSGLLGMGFLRRRVKN